MGQNKDPHPQSQGNEYGQQPKGAWMWLMASLASKEPVVPAHHCTADWEAWSTEPNYIIPGMVFYRNCETINVWGFCFCFEPLSV